MGNQGWEDKWSTPNPEPQGLLSEWLHFDSTQKEVFLFLGVQSTILQADCMGIGISCAHKDYTGYVTDIRYARYDRK